MEIEDAKRAVQIKQWADMVQMCRQSGQTVQAWCDANNINIKTYYYRLKQVRLEALKDIVPDTPMLPPKAEGYPVFAELVLAGDNTAEAHVKGADVAATTITVGRMTISIHNEAKPDVISCVIRAASEIC